MSKNEFIEFKGISKIFGSLVANDRVQLSIGRGTIHGIVGENGAGKSTAMKMLYGLISPDEGEIWIEGKAIQWSTPEDAIRAGIGMVHQHFMLAGPQTALDNILLGAEPARGWTRLLPRSLQWIDRKKAKAKLEKLSQQYGLQVPWDVPIEKLPVGVQQRIEILKLLYRDAKILILDEPTAVLTPQEVEELFVHLKKLKSEGKTLLIITHKLKEVMNFTDHVSVFRRGKVTGSTPTAQTNPQELADWMVGRKVVLKVDVPPQPPTSHVKLKVDQLRGRERLKQVSFELRGGEVLGIAGVEGNGQSELIHALLRPNDEQARTGGTVWIRGEDVTQKTTAQIRDYGLSLIPEDRHSEGLLLDRPLVENFLLGQHRRSEFSKKNVIQFKELSKKCLKSFKEFDVRPLELDPLARGLSGGNQQKLIIAREFYSNPDVLIAAQPTRGVDVGAIEFIHSRILNLRTQGAGVLLISSELDEILALSDRILVLYDGRIVGEYLRGKVSEKELGLKMGGGHENS